MADAEAVVLIRQEVENMGFKPGSPEFDVRVRALKVYHCRSSKNLDYCSACNNFTSCEIQKQHLRDIYYAQSSNETDEDNE